MTESNATAARRIRAVRATPLDRERRRARAVRLLVRAAEGQPRMPVRPSGPLIALGQIDTCLLPAATPWSRDDLEGLLELMPGRPMLWRERPMSLAVSPTTAEGVDCLLAAPAHPSVRGIGTVATRAVVVGGRVLQSSAWSSVVRAGNDQRRNWSHYLSNPGVIEVISKVNGETGARLAEGFLAAGAAPAGTLDLASIVNRLLGRVRMNPHLDQNVPLQTGTTQLRWAVRIDAVERPRVAFRLQNDTVRTVLLTVRDEDELAQAQWFCEDLAVHDWLLTVIAAALVQSDLFDPGSDESVAVLAPVLHHLAHLWVPGAHTPRPLRGLWAQLQEDPDFTADRQGLIDQVRNRVLVAALDAAQRRAETKDYSPD
ncbi:SCO2521 family protein [Nocardia sp. NPDC005998]|uniref:SCO2521 family protein n=1 Tax=Nocardia sp. NPDC005998 TaxID=3156894 RepID=UPI0033BD6FDC